MQYRQIFDDAIGKLKAEQRYRVFADIERDSSRFPHATWRKPDGSAHDVTIWCSNDYLGMGVNPEVIAAMKSAAAKHGAGAGGTRNISGTSHPLVKLEAELADLHGKEVGAGLHLRLDLQSRRHFDHRRPFAQLPDPLRRAQP